MGLGPLTTDIVVSFVIVGAGADPNGLLRGWLMLRGWNGDGDGPVGSPAMLVVVYSSDLIRFGLRRAGAKGSPSPTPESGGSAFESTRRLRVGTTLALLNESCCCSGVPPPRAASALRTPPAELPNNPDPVSEGAFVVGGGIRETQVYGLLSTSGEEKFGPQKLLPLLNRYFWETKALSRVIRFSTDVGGVGSGDSWWAGLRFGVWGRRGLDQTGPGWQSAFSRRSVPSYKPEYANQRVVVSPSRRMK